MANKIIYNNEHGSLTIIIPAEGFDINEVARKDVPAGVAYKIVDDSVFPSDREFRNAWETEIVEPDGYGIGADAWFAEQGVLNDNN
jgi:hypothetical protein